MSQRLASVPSLATLCKTSIREVSLATSFFSSCSFFWASSKSARSASSLSSRVERCSVRRSRSASAASRPALISARADSALAFCDCTCSISARHLARFACNSPDSASIRSKRLLREFTWFVFCRRSFASSLDWVRRSSTLSRMTCKISRSRSSRAFISSTSLSELSTAFSSSRRARSERSSCTLPVLRSISSWDFSFAASKLEITSRIRPMLLFKSLSSIVAFCTSRSKSR